MNLGHFDFDIIVVGAGHAGIEASLASARLGLSTLVVTTNVERIGYMSCNPSIGGLAKGHMVREIDILGGEMGLVADETCIQFKRLNSRKGPAVRGSRVQSDKDKYSLKMRQTFYNTENLKVLQGDAQALILNSNQRAEGVVLADGSKIRSRAVIITTGTFLNGVIHIGNKMSSGGRAGDPASIGLSDQLISKGFEVQRLKTGTPARLISSSIDWSKTIPQYGDAEFYPFSLRSAREFKLRQVACYLSRTTTETHDIIRKNLDKSPLFCGQIEGTGPRYCPSVEDKITRFADKESHQTFLEPEGLDSELIYLQGISTSLPEDVQMEFLKTIPGLKDVKVARYGYAVEYDFVLPTQIWHRLETRQIPGLYLAGQINGTSGYEEAAAQGLVAGINAARDLMEKEEFVMARDESYIGVLIDDLVTKGTREPYRMFTSRAEHRLVLREDNTLERLTAWSKEIGLQKIENLAIQDQLRIKRDFLVDKMKTEKVFPKAEMQAKLAKLGTQPLLKSVTWAELLRRPEMDWEKLVELGFEMDRDPLVSEPVEIEIKYSGYIKRQLELIDQARRFEELRLDNDMDYSPIRGLSNEEREKLTRIKPRTLGQAQRISGVNPSGIQAIMIYLKSKDKKVEGRSIVQRKRREEYLEPNA